MRDIKYIIKRIIIGTGIALALMFIKTNVFASEISPYTWNGVYWDESSGVSTLTWNVPNSPWSNHGNGVLRFTVGITKTSGSSTDPLIVPRMISAYNGSTRYVCDIGTASGNNSTFVGNTYSVSCPMNLDSNGVTQILLAFMPFSTQAPLPYYRIYISPDASYEVFDSTNVNVSVNNNGTIQNDNQNTQSIINNQNNNTQSIINNQNQNTQSINDTLNDNLQTCSSPTYYSTISNAYLDTSGRLRTSSSVNDMVFVYQVSKLNLNYSFVFNNFDRIRVIETDQVISPGGSGTSTHTMLINTASPVIGDTYSLFASKRYLYFYLSTTSTPGSISFIDSCVSKIDQTNNNLQDLNNTINNDNVDSSTGSDFFNNFQSDSHGLSGIITAPLRLIQSLSSSQCSPLVLPLPFVNQSANIPCMSTVYSTFPTFYNLWQLITTGLIAYYILINLFSKVHSLQNPQDDRIEVLNL